MKNRIAKSIVVILALVWAIGLTPAGQAQTFKKVTVQHKAKMAKIASGGVSVWGLDTNGHPFLYKGTSFVQESTTITLAQIAVGGGNARQSDTVWALDPAGNIYQVVKSGTTYLFNLIPGNLDFIAVGIGYQDSCHPYEVWGLNTSSEIWRYNFCASSWDQEPGFLCAIQVGGGDIWGTQCNGNLFRFDFASMSFLQQSSSLPADLFAVGPQSVWETTYDSLHQTGWARQIIPQPGGSGEYSTLSGPIAQIQAGGDGVWVMNSSGQAFVLRYASGSFVQIPTPALLASIIAGSGGGVWAIDPTGLVYAFSTP